MTVIHLSPLDLHGALIEGLAPLPFEKGLLQGDGQLQSPVLQAAFPFDDLVGSWNAEVPKGAFIEMQAQARREGRWTKWFRLSRWEPGAPGSLGRQEDADGYVDVDTLRLKRKADAFRYRISLGSKGARHPKLMRIAVTYDDSTRKPDAPAPFASGPWVRELKLRSRSQMAEQAAYRRDICSPTALAMVLDFWGIRRKTSEIAALVKDHKENIYGNWPLNIAAAAELGLAGVVARLPSLGSLQEEIAAGRPTIVSIAYNQGELAGSPIKRTRGHLLVVTGFTAKGDVITRDPAAPKRGTVRRVYRRAQFAKAWLGRKRGLAYLLSARFPEELVVGVPTADLRARPRAPRAPSADDRGLKTQVLYGESVRVLEARGDWVRVSVLDQPHSPRGGTWTGYPGWMRAEDLRRAPLPYSPNTVVRSKRADLRWEDAAGSEESLTLPLGALLAAQSQSGPISIVRLLDGRPAKVQSAAVRPLTKPPGPVDRRDIIETAALFLGDGYVWGGRSSLQKRPGWGVDCSGLVQLAYRSVGLTVPRDAHDQYLRARPLKRRGLKPGDLVFLTKTSRSKKVDHVLLYTGGDGLIESRASAGKTVRTTFSERFGAPLSAINSGDIVPDITHKKSFRRRIYFGSFLTDK